jgi:hypothetical protein
MVGVCALGHSIFYGGCMCTGALDFFMVGVCALGHLIFYGGCMCTGALDFYGGCMCTGALDFLWWVYVHWGTRFLEYVD